MVGKEIVSPLGAEGEKSISLAKAWSNLSAGTQRMIMTTLIGLGIVALPNTGSAQTDLQTWFSNSVNTTIPVGTSLSTTTSYDYNIIIMNNNEGNCLKIVIDHANPNFPNDTLVASIAVGPTAYNENGISSIESYPGDIVTVIGFDSGNQPVCEPNYNSDSNGVKIADGTGSNPDVDVDACVRSEIVLPIELKKFIARCIGEGQGVQLVWNTASEINNDGFWVQRSTNGVDRENIAWVDAAGTGTSSAEQEYSMEDTEANDHKQKYYRLKQVDFDGDFDYSPIESVTNCDNGTGYDVQMFPNPVVDILKVKITSADKELAQTVQVFNMLGQKVGETVARDSGELNIDFSGVPAGPYKVVVTEGNGTNRRVETIIKN